MTDNDTSCQSRKCPLMYVALVILVHAKCYQFADGKCLAIWPNFHILTAMGEAVWLQFDEFEMYVVCTFTFHQQMLAFAILFWSHKIVVFSWSEIQLNLIKHHKCKVLNNIVPQKAKQFHMHGCDPASRIFCSKWTI